MKKCTAQNVTTYSESDKPTLVIARYNEDISWSDGKKRVIIQKDEDIPNIGHEPTSFLLYIIKEYCRLEGTYYFVQGNPYDHWNPLDGKDRTKFISKPNGTPHHQGLPIHEVCKELELPILDEYEFHPGGQFEVTAEQIKERPWEWYVKALHICTKGENPWVFERLWNYIFES